MFLDSSAIVAILLNEADAPRLVSAMEGGRGSLLFSPVVRLSAISKLVAARNQIIGKVFATESDFTEAAAIVDDLIAALGAKEVHITASIGRTALKAMASCGEQTAHPLKLDMADALSYACAKAYRLRLLVSKSDFEPIEASPHQPSISNF